MPPQSSSSLTRHIPAIITGVTVAAVVISFHLYILKRQQDQRRHLKRSNARRVRRRNSATRSGTVPSTTAAGTAGTTTSPQVPSTSHQTATTTRRSTSQPPAEVEPGDMSENEGNLLSTAQLEQQLEQELTFDYEEISNGGLQQETATSELSFSPEGSKENQNLLNLLYLIAEDQAKREGYVHRGVSCNSCNVQPIRGIRYRCANCVDFDLCEHCEALDAHPKTHLFYKVKIPAQFLGNPRHVLPPSYPGKPGNMPPSLGMELVKEFEKKSGFDQAEVEALYEQFKCLAATEYPNDPYRIGGAISRKTFDKCIYLSYSSRPPPPNLIYDRMFALYDTNNDGLIGFEEFILGLAALHTKPRLDDKWKRIFKGYDLDGDGYVERKDFLKMFRAYYTLSKEHVQDIVARMEEEMIESGASTNVLLGSQPISAAFPSLSLEAHVGGGKAASEIDQEMFGGIVLPSGNDEATREEMERFRAETLGRDTFTTEASSQASLVDGDAEAFPFGVDPALDELNNLRVPVPQPERREEGSLSDTENIPPVSPIPIAPGVTTTSGSSFQGNEIDFYTIAPEAGDDIGNEVLYQVTQQGLNELLNMLFKVKEDGAVEVRKRQQRRQRGREKEMEKREQVGGSSSEPNTDEAQEPGTSSPTTAATDISTPAQQRSSSVSPPLAPSTPSKPSSIPKAQARYELYKAKMESDQDKFLDRIEAEIKERGGPGRINYEEFEKLMRQDGWRRFAFVGSWVDMISF